MNGLFFLGEMGAGSIVVISVAGPGKTTEKKKKLRRGPVWGGFCWLSYAKFGSRKGERLGAARSGGRG